MRRTITYRIHEPDNHKTIQTYLQERGYSHAVFVLLKATSNSILVNQRWCYLRDVLCTGDELTVVIDDDSQSKNVIPVTHPLDIRFEDEDILVVNKPSDTPVHPSRNNYDNSLANYVMAYEQSLGHSFSFRCINRLDRDTTGLTIIARHMLSAAILNRSMTQRTIHREYLAIVEGIPPLCGTVDAPIGRTDASSIARCIDPVHGERAVTHYRRIACRDGLSLLALHLDTGRTHQIRVHMSSIGYPLIGDALYNPVYRDNNSKHKISRQALHSHRLSFTHPITGESVVLTCPLPDDMRCFFPDY